MQAFTRWKVAGIIFLVSKVLTGYTNEWVGRYVPVLIPPLLVVFNVVIFAIA
jgi:hypothetical protein